jgi:hypothetical protein
MERRGGCGVHMIRTWQEVIRPQNVSPAFDRGYEEGFRDGWLDSGMGVRNQVALNSPEPQGYSTGYYDGQMARQREGVESR